MHIAAEKLILLFHTLYKTFWGNNSSFPFLIIDLSYLCNINKLVRWNSRQLKICQIGTQSQINDHWNDKQTSSLLLRSSILNKKLLNNHLCWCLFLRQINPLVNMQEQINKASHCMLIQQNTAVWYMIHILCLKSELKLMQVIKFIKCWLYLQK